MAEEASWAHEIPCIRHDESGQANARVRETLAYAAGLCGNSDFFASITELHDRKGVLSVQWRDQHSMALYWPYLDRAWREYANEHGVEHSSEDD